MGGSLTRGEGDVGSSHLEHLRGDCNPYIKEHQRLPVRQIKHMYDTPKSALTGHP